MESLTIPKSLEDVRADDQSFPHDVLVGCKTALALFSANFYGRQDAFWLAEAGLGTTCVDVDGERLEAMAAIYPAGWEFVECDAYEYAELSWRMHRQWDVVTADPYTNHFTICADNVDSWCKVARRAVILGTGVDTSVTAPPGWRIASVRKRSTYDGGVWWTCLERV